MSRYPKARFTNAELGIIRSITAITKDTGDGQVFRDRDLQRILDKIDRARGDAEAKPSVMCPNCQSQKHTKCCARCGAIMRPSRWEKSAFCTARCEREQAHEDRVSSELEEDYGN